MGQYNPSWVNSPNLLPQIGMKCPSCNQGFIEDNSFTSFKKDPKGISYQSVTCKTCKKDWVVSRYPPKGQQVEVQRGGEEDFSKAIPVTKDDLLKIWDEIEQIKKRLDRHSNYMGQIAQGKETEPHIED